MPEFPELPKRPGIDVVVGVVFDVLPVSPVAPKFPEFPELPEFPEFPEFPELPELELLPPLFPVLFVFEGAVTRATTTMRTAAPMKIPATANHLPRSVPYDLSIREMAIGPRIKAPIGMTKARTKVQMASALNLGFGGGVDL